MKTQIKILIAVSVAILVVVAFYNGLVVRDYEVETDAIESGTEIKVVLISDLHSSKYGKDQSKIAELIREQNPDIIALTGDIGDKRRSIDAAEQFVKAVSDIAPIYYVTGNHEFASGQAEDIKLLFGEHGLHILEGGFEDIYIKGQRLVVGGIDDPLVNMNKAPGVDWEGQWKNGLVDAFTDIEQEQGYKILLSHRPEYVEIYKDTDFDMVLSGHAHGGQIRIPFILNGLFAPNQGFFPKYAGGVYEHEDMTHIVSRGTSFSFFLPRIFNPPEVVAITIKGK